MHDIFLKIKHMQQNNKYGILIILFYTLFIDYSLQSISYPLYILPTILFFILLNQISLIAYKIVILIIGILSSCYLPIQLMYGRPNFSMMISILYTDHSESKEFLQHTPINYIILAVASLCVSFLAYHVRVAKLRRSTNLVQLVIFSSITMLNPVQEYKKIHSVSFDTIKLPFIVFFTDAYNGYFDAIKEQDRMDSLVKTPDTWNPTISSANKYNTFILVIGESVRKDFMHSYGFHIANTPFTDEAKGTLYSNYFSAGPNTVISLTNSLDLDDDSFKSEPNNNVISLAKKAGFYTYWLSNQGSIGGADTIISSFGKIANYNYFLKKGDFDSELTYDTQLIPQIESALQDNKNQPKLIVIHLIGSHQVACRRTNNKYDVFFMSKEVSCYVQSIKNTDLLLQQITRLANKNKAKWSMVYFSDHGLKMIEKDSSSAALVHGDEYRQNYNVPLFISNYDSASHEVNNNLYTAMNFMSMFSQWTGIYDKKILVKCNPLSNKQCEGQIKVLNDNNQIKYLESLPTQEIK